MSTPTEGTVYLVTTGEYSDYRVVGVYTNEALAETAAGTMGATADAEVKEMPLNPAADELNHGLGLWDVTMRLMSGARHQDHE